MKKKFSNILKIRHWTPYAIVANFVRQIFTQFSQDQCAIRAAALAFTSLLSLVPLMTVSITVLAAFPIFKQLSGQIQTFIFENFVATSAQVIQQQVLQFASHAMNLSASGVFFLVVSSILMIFNMEQAFNVIWRVRRSRKGLPALMMYWGLMTLLPISIGVVFAIGSYLISMPFIEGTTESLSGRQLLLTIFPYLLTFVAFSVLYITLPNCKVLVRHAMAGGAVATVLFESAKYGFGLYASRFSAYELLYGTLAVIPIFLLWVYFSWLIILFGAVVAHVLSGDNSSEPVVTHPPPK
jgi:membrane protein